MTNAKNRPAASAPALTTATPPGPTRARTSGLTEQDAAFINRLFEKLQAIFPAWRNAFDSDQAVAEAKRQWTKGLIDAGVTEARMLNAGLRRARLSETPFLPSVGQFVAWCREALRERIQFPDVDTVLQQIIRYSHSARYPSAHYTPTIDPVAYWIYQRIDKHLLLAAKLDDAHRLLKPRYQEAMQLAGTGFVFPPPPVLIPEDIGGHAPRTPAQIAAAEQARREVRQFQAGQAAHEGEPY